MGNNPEVPALSKRDRCRGSSERRGLNIQSTNNRKTTETSNKEKDFFMLALWKPRAVNLRGQTREKRGWVHCHHQSAGVEMEVQKGKEHREDTAALGVNPIRLQDPSLCSNSIFLWLQNIEVENVTYDGSVIINKQFIQEIRDQRQAAE